MPSFTRLLAIVALCFHIPGARPASEEVRIDDWVQRYGGTLARNQSGEIVEIDLGRTWVNDVGLERLRGLRSLEVLGLAQTHITDSALAIVKSLPSLRALDLFFCEHVTDAGASQLREASSIEQLNVRGTKISGSGVKFLTEIAALRSLDIGITEIDDPSIELMEALPRLESLAIGGNRISEVGISSLRGLRQLRHLDLSGAQVTDSGIWAVTVTDLNLDEIGSLRGLESLNLAAPSPEYVDAVSSGVPRLRGAIRVTDFGASKLARLGNLRRLNLSRSYLSAAGVERLHELERLEELVLSNCKSIDAAAGRALAKLASLKTLDVSFTSFDDAALAALTEHPTLKRLVAAGTRLSEEAVAEFVRSRPGRSVIR